jgi:transporter family-2 protein
VAWLFSGRAPIMDIFQVEHKYTLLGGVIGAFITYTVIKSMGDLGPAKAVLIIVVSQVLVAWLIELFGLFGAEKATFEWHKLIGMLLAIGGIVVFKWS